MTFQDLSLRYKIALFNGTSFKKVSPRRVSMTVIAIVLGFIGLANVSSNFNAHAVDIPPNAQPGAILQHQNQTQQFQNQAPWLNRPITTQDQTGPDIDIKQVETNVNAEIHTEPEPQAPCQTAPGNDNNP